MASLPLYASSMKDIIKVVAVEKSDILHAYTEGGKMDLTMKTSDDITKAMDGDKEAYFKYRIASTGTVMLRERVSKGFKKF